MNGKAITFALVLGLVLAAAPAVNAYHITGAASPAPCSGTLGLTSADWCIGGGPLIICESEGLADDRNMHGVPQVGQGGLCVTGDNAVTRDTTTVPGFVYGMPAPNTILRMDACDLTTAARGGAGACPNGMLAGADGIKGTADDVAGGADNTDGIRWSFQTTAFSCVVWTVGQTRAAPFANTVDDAAIYYEALYAWWDMDGDGSYTAGGPAAGSIIGLPDNDPPYNLGIVPFSDGIKHWHGHVAMFIATADPTPVSTTGSAAITNVFGSWAAARDFSTARAAGFGTGTWLEGQIGGAPFGVDPLTIGGQSNYNQCGLNPAGNGGLFSDNGVTGGPMGTTGPAVRGV